MFKLEDTSSSGAVFFAVCRGKVCLLFLLKVKCLGMPQYAIYFFGDKNKNLIGIGVTFHAPT